MRVWKEEADVLHTKRKKAEEDKNNNSLVLSLHSDEFPSHRSLQAWTVPDDKPPPSLTAPIAIYDCHSSTSSHKGTSWASFHLRSVPSPLGPDDSVKRGLAGHVLAACPPVITCCGSFGTSAPDYRGSVTSSLPDTYDSHHRCNEKFHTDCSATRRFSMRRNYIIMTQ